MESRTERKKKAEKKKRWSPQQIDLLLEIWADRIQELRGTRRNNHIFQEMKAQLEAFQCFVSVSDIKVRIHNITSKYRSEKAKIGPSGGSPSEWPLYHKVHEILGSFAINNVSSLVEESIVESDADMTSDHYDEVEVLDEYAVPVPDGENDQHVYGESSSQFSTVSTDAQTSNSPGSGTPGSTPGTGKRGRKSNFQNEILKRWDLMDDDTKQQEERIKQTDEKMLELEQKRTELLEKFVNDTAEFKNAFIRFLNSRDD